MGKSQRAKGASYEREVAAVFSAALGARFSRNIAQARDGGHDVIVGPLVIECKRRKTLITLRKWLAQATAAARRVPSLLRLTTKAGITPNTEITYNTEVPSIPVVVTREDNGESMVLIKLQDFVMLTRDELLRYS